jgi:hypothetical protein
MIIFDVKPDGQSWCVTRNSRLVCHYSSLPIAVTAVEGFVSELRKHGKCATLLPHNDRLAMAKTAVTEIEVPVLVGADAV